LFAGKARRFCPFEFVTQLHGEVLLDQPASIQRYVPFMDQREFHFVVVDGEFHDQVELTRAEDIGRAPVRKEIAVNE
jgi:hypothetical protein